MGSSNFLILVGYCLGKVKIICSLAIKSRRVQQLNLEFVPQNLSISGLLFRKGYNNYIHVARKIISGFVPQNLKFFLVFSLLIMNQKYGE